MDGRAALPVWRCVRRPDDVVWLAQRMAHYGQRIEAGQIILSGSFIRPVECPPGTDIAADFGPFGNVAIKFA